MSRSGYNDEADFDSNWPLICWRGAVSSAIKGKRGQRFIRDLIDALDAMPKKALIADELAVGGEFCAIGAVAARRGLPVEDLDPEDITTVAEAIEVAPALAREIVYINDEGGYYNESSEERWHRVRQWAERAARRVGVGQ